MCLQSENSQFIVLIDSSFTSKLETMPLSDKLALNMEFLHIYNDWK